MNKQKQLKKDLNVPTPKLGRVCINISYVVDLNNEIMVEEAKDAVYEDLCAAVKSDELYSNITVIEDKKAKLKDIPDFLLGDPNEEQ